MIVVSAERPKGYATSAFQVVEEQARRLGLAAVGLHNFATRPEAIRLYQRLGCQTASLNLLKVIQGRGAFGPAADGPGGSLPAPSQRDRATPSAVATPNRWRHVRQSAVETRAALDLVPLPLHSRCGLDKLHHGAIVQVAESGGIRRGIDLMGNGADEQRQPQIMCRLHD